MLSVTKNLNGDIYLSGNGARSYMNIENFKSQGIDVIFQDFYYSKYNQVNSI